MKITKPTKKIIKAQKRNYKKGMLLKKYPRNFFEECPPLPAVVDALKDDVWAWAFNPKDEDFTMLDYLYERNISYVSWRKLMNKHPDLKTEWENAKIFIGNKREKGALKRDLSEKVVLRSMPMYSENWKELEQWYAKIRSMKEEIKDIVLTLNDLVNKKEAIEKNDNSSGK